MSLEQIAVIIRLIMIPIYGYLFYYFYKGYQKSKRSGFKNNYFLGFSLMLLILVIFHIVYGLYELQLLFTNDELGFKDYFSWWIERYNNDQLDESIRILRNQMRPLYLIFYFIINLVFALQVYPLEKALQWEKTPFSKLIVILGSLNWLIFIPAIGITIFAYVTLTAGFLGIVLGFALNIGANIKIYFLSTGSLKKQSILAILAFLLLGIGLFISLEVQFESLIGWDPKFDIIFGCILQILAVICYRIGFKVEK